MDTKATLAAIESAVLAVRPKFRFEPPASASDLESLRAATQVKMPDVLAWFSWHAGSEEGFIAASSVGLIGLNQALNELRFLAANPSSPPLPRGHCPLLEDGGGGLWIYVARNDGEVWGYDRGTIRWTKPFAVWLEEQLETWRAERHVLRVEFVRRGRTMVGWQFIELPLRSKKKVIAWLREPESPLVVRAPGSSVRFTIGERVVWPAPDADTEVVLTTDVASHMAGALARADGARVADLEARVSFSQR